jgi:hypothetical protein
MIPVNTLRLFLAAVAGTVAYFAFGFLAFGLLPTMKDEFMKYPGLRLDEVPGGAFDGQSWLRIRRQERVGESAAIR